ncbi:dTDP-4-dehydrorhamnose reductase [Halorientalis persicus]|uniref:dTDP-4-dehydrorhamnose reductase n=1 Tax=Halorientalis persicus TaxID=1367881 RepID=A0A1H8VF92_9EURY|nr:sugar nucleotide-binding protein [Halorientalis persicus]SEP14126.1 dTDP-4-dehydrorhamnose reductase [Halorientalis persicus]
MDVLITGSSGFLGNRFQELLGKDHNVAGTYYKNAHRSGHQLDITHRPGVISLFQDLNPDVVIHTAAIADPDTCYNFEQNAFEVNVQGTENVAEAAKRVGAKLVHISTSFVFPAGGEFRPNDEPNPQTVYGQTKYKAERAVCEASDNSVILRCPKLFGNGRQNEVRDITSSILYRLSEEESIELDDTVKRFPVFVDDVVSATEQLIDVGATGIYHISTDKPYTKYEFGKEVAEIFNSGGQIIPGEKNPPAERPSNIKLNTDSLQRLGVNISPVSVALDTLKHQRACSFKAIYSFKPDQMVEGKSASKIRAELGKELGRGDNIEADMVVPVPESGIYPATGYADETGIPLYHGIIRDYETERTLYEPNIEDRTRKLRKKLVAVQDILEGKRVVLVDEAIISGLTLATVIDKCQSAGVEEIHVRIPSPPMRTQCSYGVLSDDAELVADTNGLGSDRESIQTHLEQKFNLSSLQYLSVEDFKRIVPSDYGYTCTNCFYGDEDR